MRTKLSRPRKVPWLRQNPLAALGQALLSQRGWYMVKHLRHQATAARQRRAAMPKASAEICDLSKARECMWRTAHRNRSAQKVENAFVNRWPSPSVPNGAFTMNIPEPIIRCPSRAAANMTS